MTFRTMSLRTGQDNINFKAISTSQPKILILLDTLKPGPATSSRNDIFNNLRSAPIEVMMIIFRYVNSAFHSVIGSSHKTCILLVLGGFV